jgi:hypothetical protein
VSFGFDGDAKIETCYRIISRGSTPHRISAIPVGGYKQEQIPLQKQPVTTIHYADVNSPARFSCPQDPIGIIEIFGKESNGIKPLRFNILNHCDNPIELVECVNRISMERPPIVMSTPTDCRSHRSSKRKAETDLRHFASFCFGTVSTVKRPAV